MLNGVKGEEEVPLDINELIEQAGFSCSILKNALKNKENY